MTGFRRVLWVVVACLGISATQARSADTSDKPAVNSGSTLTARTEALHETLYRRSQSGDAEAMTNLATLMEQGDEIAPIDLKIAYDLYEPAARLGNPVAVKKMCLAYLLGEGRPKDVIKASGFCNKVDATDAVTYFWGGYDYQYGVTGPADLDSARASYQVAVERGSGEAADAIGQMAFNGGHFDVARGWYRKGATLGSADAMDHLAGMAEQGQGGGKDSIEAAWLYGYAGQRGNSHAQDWLRAHPGLEVSSDNLGKGASEITLTHIFGQGAAQKTEPLTVSRLSTLMHRRLDGVISNSPDHYYYFAYFDCYVGLSREVDLCVTSREYPLGFNMGDILRAVWGGRISLPERDADGNPTAQSHFKFGLSLVSAD
ncbi:MAG: tetratricopeptide repeat protein [Asticcacaulis sp.]|uniref:tetratricopeptide repeat protein n=1 Tax=Asticcacaulis sp. TaxID=1872648 RepID=UPI0039E2B911